MLVCTDNGRFGVTSAFFDKYYGANSLSGSLIWLGACQSHKDSRLTDVLLNKGASTVVGSSWNIYIPYLVSLTNQFFTRLTEKDSSGQFYTADAALAYAKNAAFAPTDSFFFAEMERTGSGSFRLGGVSASLTGFVTSSATNQPIPNAKITLSGSSQSATTDSAGKYTISSVSSGAAYSVKAEAEGYLSATKSVTTSTGSTGVNFSLDPVPSVSIKLSPDSGTVTKGTVTVYKLSGTSQTKVGTHSFTTSSFVIGDLEAGVSYKLEIAADGFQTTSVTAKAASSPVTQIVALKELQGKIRLSLVPDSGTVTGGTVTVTKTAGLTAGTAETSPFTGSQFEIGELEPGAQYKVTIQAEGYNAATVTVTASASPAATTVALTAKTTAPVATRTVTVNVKEYDSAASLSGATVTLFGRASSSDSYTQIATGTTNSSGQFVYQVPSNYKLLKAEATKSGYVRGSVEDITSNSITLRLSKEPDLTPSIPAGYTPIYTGEEFNALAGNEKVILMADITGVRLKSSWTGVLEGNHHSMTSQGYDPSYTHVSGLFFMENHGEIRNVRFSNVSLSGGGTVWTGVIGANGGTIENCLVSGRIAISSKGRGAAGGLVGTNYESGVIRNCVNQATVTVTVALSEDRQSTSAYAGGIAGANYGTIDHCLNLGTVSAASTNYVYVGGISAEAGAAGTCTVRDCGNGGSLSRQFHPVGNGATGGYQYALSVSATEGYATDVGGASYLKQVTLSELRTMWADVL